MLRSLDLFGEENYTIPAIFAGIYGISGMGAWNWRYIQGTNTATLQNKGCETSGREASFFRMGMKRQIWLPLQGSPRALFTRRTSILLYTRPQNPIPVDGAVLC